MTLQHDVEPHHCRRSAPHVAPAFGALRGLPAAGQWLWLVTPAAVEAAIIAALVLFHVLPGLLVTLGAQVGRHG